MITFYSQEDITSFANYCLSEKRNNLVSDVNKNIVTHADFQNWLISVNELDN